MKASELMIGNYVIFLGKVRKIKSIIRKDTGIEISFEGKNPVVVSLDEIEPIPLTPEILEKNGFDVLSHENPAAFAYKKEGVSIVEVYWNGPERGYRCIFSYGDTRLRITCNFVHELQNALRLCGITLNIEV